MLLDPSSKLKSLFLELDIFNYFAYLDAYRRLIFCLSGDVLNKDFLFKKPIRLLAISYAIMFKLILLLMD